MAMASFASLETINCCVNGLKNVLTVNRVRSSSLSIPLIRGGWAGFTKARGASSGRFIKADFRELSQGVMRIAEGLLESDGNGNSAPNEE
jgi:hypothetical protein